MKKFIKAIRDLKSHPKELKCKLVWNPNPFLPYQNQWIITTMFSTKFIELKGLEVVYG